MSMAVRPKFTGKPVSAEEIGPALRASTVIALVAGGA
jgi:hypothetical protein